MARENDSTVLDVAASSAVSKSTAILVIGMHRSGTSALTRLLNLLGMELGDDLLPANATNESGYWEHRELPLIHDQILEALDRHWTSVSAFPEGWWNDRKIASYRAQLKHLVERDFGNGTRLWGLKDPRLCFFLPLWRAILAELDCEPRCVITVRNPVEVAASLEKRNGMSVTRACLLWLRSVISSERDSRGLSRTITTYQAILTDWRTELQRIGRNLQIEWPVGFEEAAIAADKFIRPAMRHHCLDDSVVLADSAIPEPVRRLYGALLEAADGRHIDDLSPIVDGISEEWARHPPVATQLIAALERDLRFAERNCAIYESRLGEIQSLLATESTMIAEERIISAERIAIAQQRTSELIAQLATLDEYRKSS